MKILIAVDQSDYSRKAIAFISSRKTLLANNPDIDVLNVQWRLPPHPARVVGMRVVREYYADEAEKALRPARKHLRKAGFNPNVGFAVGHPALEISERADKDDVDLLVLGSKGHSAFGGLLLGSVTNEVLARTRRATLIVRAGARQLGDSLRVGIAADGSAYGPAALRYVLNHLPFFGASPAVSLIHSVHTYDLVGMPSAEAFAPPAFSPEEVRRLQDKQYEAVMRPLRKVLKKSPGVSASEVRLVGDAGRQLSNYAKKHLDLLVMGSHGYGAFKAAVMGSVAARVIASGAVPLLLIRNPKS